MKLTAVGRYLLVVALFLLCLLGVAGWLHHHANQQAGAGRLATAQEHFGHVIADLEQQWGREAFNLRARLESIRYLDDSSQRGRLMAYLTSQGASLEFPSLRVEDRQGKALFAHEYVRYKLPEVHFLPSQESIWAYEPSEERLFRVYRQPIWVGKENAYLYLFKPMDHALLNAYRYPGTNLSLWWDGKPVASSEGQDGLAAETGKLVPGPTSAVLSWQADESGAFPTLKIEVAAMEIISTFDLLLPLFAGLLAFAAGSWLLLRHPAEAIDPSPRKRR